MITWCIYHTRISYYLNLKTTFIIKDSVSKKHWSENYKCEINKDRNFRDEHIRQWSISMILH